MEKQTTPATPDEKIAYAAKTWRPVDRAAIADKGNSEKQRAEYRERKNLRKVIDDAGVES